HRVARRHLEPGQGAVVAQCLDAEMPARDSRTAPALALRPLAPRAAPRRALDNRGRGPRARRAGEAAGHRSDAQCKLRADAGALPPSAARDAGARAKAEEAGFPLAKAALADPMARRWHPAFAVWQWIDCHFLRLVDKLGAGRRPSRDDGGPG